MPAEGENLARMRPQDDGLESYRRLIELQKQMIALSQQHEQAKRECAVLREQVADEIAQRLREGLTWRQRLQRAAGQGLRRLPGFGAGEMKWKLLLNKPESSC